MDRFFHDPRTPGTSEKIISVEGLDDDPPTIEVLLCNYGIWNVKNTTYSKKDMRALNVL
ncbi:MAG: hypothetical protein IT223_12500 [Crocinitomicaceae bacterium]|nr:hypothetical protein [Crocinitomicaceae bacterium]